MINEQLLRQGLQKLLKDTDFSIRERLADEPTLEAALRDRHAAAVRAERTESSAKGYNAFADEAITQAAVHWLLGCVFVRFLEDNGWLDERNSKVGWISGPGDRLAIAKGRRTAFLRPDPDLTDRDYLLYVFAEMAKLPGVAGLFDQIHNPLYSLQPTGPGVGKIVEFFQKVDPDSNALIHDFTDPAHGTRFLGDLYQNLSESARKRYALCQTPGFVIDFILDRTLTPALDAFGLDTIRLIDPSCGSGHFLLAAFDRLFSGLQKKHPSTNPPALVQLSLNAVYGVDLNPFAVEISRFRLLIAALGSSGIDRLKDAPIFQFNLAAGDSLLHGSRAGGGIARHLFEDRLQHFYDTEDAEELKRILGQAYHVVVGNPPYINVNDSVLREAYRSRFQTCHGKYQLGVPFTERFFDLTLSNEDTGINVAGWVGMIVSDAFMKRSFGKKLIESFLRNKDLTHVISTSGVYLPGHGTPTAILLGRNQPPVSVEIREVRGKLGESGVPDDPANAPVWLEIAHHAEQPGFEGSYISVIDAPRELRSQHPWPIGGGGATELKEALEENCSSNIGGLSVSQGIMCFTLEKDLYSLSSKTANRLGIPQQFVRTMIEGDEIRDWTIQGAEVSIFPYREDFSAIDETDSPPLMKALWFARTALGQSKLFGGVTKLAAGLKWYEWGRLTISKAKIKKSVAFGEIATHNHFALDLTGRFFNNTTRVIKLADDATEEEHLELLGLLNSSVACFWLKQICFPKGGDHVGTEGARVTRHQWEERYAFDSTKLKQLPIPEEKPLAITKAIRAAADERAALLPERLCAVDVPTRSGLDAAKSQTATLLARMIALHEELDWQCYRLYGIIGEDLTLPSDQVPSLQLGERAFEIVLARFGKESLWFERHRSTPISESPSHWPAAYCQLVERRIAALESNRDISLVERPEYKRRWNFPTWEEMETSALKSWLLDRIESNDIWRDLKPVSCAQLRDALARNLEWLSVAEIYHGKQLEDLDQFVADLVTSESVPFLPALRYTEAGLRKRREWEQVWNLQRQQDAGEKVDIPVPPKYSSKDFQKGDYWRLRGGLDVSKERFILYPGLQRDSDETSVVGWAGWSDLERAKALASYYQRMRNEEGWEPERLKPILAGLLHLREWLKQWHDDLDPETGLKLGTYFSDFAEAQCHELGFSPQQVLAWKLPAGQATSRTRKSRAK